MEKINSETSLNDAILQLERKHAEEGIMLKKQFYIAFDSIKPINLLKSTFKEAAASQELKTDILKTALGLIAGYLSKKALENATNSPLKKILGISLLAGFSTFIANNPDMVRKLGMILMSLMQKKTGTGIRIQATGSIETK
jgi:hypothetical protein